MIARLRAVVTQQLTQGTSPEKLAWSLSWGAVLGCFPFIGTTTALCLAAGALFKLNHAALQAANYLVYPLQFVLIAPFVRVGERLFGLTPVPLDPREVFKLGIKTLAGTYAWALGAGAGAWALAAVPAAMTLYVGLLPLLRSLASRKTE